MEEPNEPTKTTGGIESSSEAVQQVAEGEGYHAIPATHAEEAALPPTSAESQPDTRADKSADAAHGFAFDAPQLGAAEPHEEAPAQPAPVSDSLREEDPTPNATFRSPGESGCAAPMYAPESPGWWHDLRRSAILVALGGVLGVLLTLLILLIATGTLSFASRREVRSMGRDLASVRAAQDTAQQRLEALNARTDALERKVKVLEALSGRVDALARDMTESQSRLDRVTEDLSALRSETRRVLGSLDERVTGIEGDLKVVRERVRRFDTFLSALRDLLVDIQGLAPEPAGVPTPVR